MGLQNFGAATLHVPLVTPCEETLKTVVIKKEGKICHWRGFQRFQFTVTLSRRFGAFDDLQYQYIYAHEGTQKVRERERGTEVERGRKRDTDTLRDRKRHRENE